MNVNRSKRECVYEMQLEARAEEVFPLLCPVREDDWVIDWKEIATLISSGSGVAELGAVFQTQHEGEKPVTWVVTRYEPSERIAFVRFGEDVVAGLDIVLAEVAGKTRATWTTTQVGTSEAGDVRVEAVTQEAYDTSHVRLELMLQHYLSTGQMIDAQDLHRRTDMSAQR